MEWPRVKPRDRQSSGASGVYTDLDTLMRLKFSARNFTLKPRQPLHSALAGRKASRLRGRGLDFEELRGYLPGDDVRNIDWKATARLRKPQVRVYLEERDRPCLLLVDQRLSMLFGSREKMKSVAAAEAAALGAWRVVDVGDRVGAVIFNDTEVTVVRPQRSASTVMGILRDVVRYNHLLKAGAGIHENPAMLNEALDRTACIAKHDYLVVVISDFGGIDEQTQRLWTRIAAHNDTLAVHVSDALERQLPRASRLAFQQEDRQIEVDTGPGRLRQRYADQFESRVDRARAFLARVDTPVLPIDTTGSVFEQVRSQLGRAGRPAR